MSTLLRHGRSARRRMVPLPRATSLAGIAVGQVVVWQATALAVAALVLRPAGNAQVVGAVGGVLLVSAVVALTAVPVRGRWLYRWVPVYARSYLARRHARGRAAAAAAATAAGAAAGPTAAQPSLLSRLVPGVEVVEVIDRAGVRHGLIRDGEEWAAVLGLPTGQHVVDVADPQEAPRIPWSVLAAALDDRGVRLRAVQLVRLAVPTIPSGLDWSGPLATSYAAMAGPLPPRQRVYVALRLNTADCRAAVAARGGGDDGACRALVSAVARLRYSLSQNGIRANPLTEEQVWFAARTVLAATEEDPLESIAEDSLGWRAWYADGHCHVVFTVTRWPAGENPTALLADLSMLPAAACVTSVSVQPRAHGSPGMTATLRYLCTPAELESLRSGVAALCRSRGAAVQAADGEHRLGSVLSLPFAAVNRR